MANATVLPANPDVAVRGFDTGPGNVLLDAWHQRHFGSPLDRDGNWAASGDVDATLLARLLADPYFAQPPPKSTGRELFHLAWLNEHIAAQAQPIAPANVQATLSELTAQSIALAIKKWGDASREIYLCGGGTHNSDLVRRLRNAMPDASIRSTSELGIDPDWVEAIAFAWLAQRTLAGLSGNMPAVTGARHPVVLGGIYPGRIRLATDARQVVD